MEFLDNQADVVTIEIFEHGFLKPRPSLAFAHMEVHIDHEAKQVENQITYLYKWGSLRKYDSVLIGTNWNGQSLPRTEHFKFWHRVGSWYG